MQIFAKTFKYAPSDVDKYEFYSLSAANQTNPDILYGSSVTSWWGDLMPHQIICSPLQRTMSTAALYAEALGIKVVRQSPLLMEIPFDFSTLISYQEFLADGSSAVRERFLESFHTNQLLEDTMESILCRTEAVVKMAASAEKQGINTGSCIDNSDLKS